MNNSLDNSECKEEYPIILFDPNMKATVQSDHSMHFFSDSLEFEKFVESLGKSFLLIIPSDFDLQILHQNLKENLNRRRLADFEEEFILKKVLLTVSHTNFFQ